MRTVNLTVNGVEETHDLDSILTITNPEAERPKAAADMAWWGAVWGAAEEQVLLTEAQSTHWKGKAQEEALALDPKAAEWKVLAAVHAQPQYLENKREEASAKRQAVAARALFEAHTERCRLLRAMLGGRDNVEKSESDAIGSTPVSGVAEKVDKAEKVNKAAAAIKATRAQKP